MNSQSGQYWWSDELLLLEMQQEEKQWPVWWLLINDSPGVSFRWDPGVRLYLPTTHQELRKEENSLPIMPCSDLSSVTAVDSGGASEEEKNSTRRGRSCYWRSCCLVAVAIEDGCYAIIHRSPHHLLLLFVLAVHLLSSLLSSHTHCEGRWENE